MRTTAQEQKGDHSELDVTCQICGYHAHPAEEKEVGLVRGNTARFKSRLFRLWKCPACSTIYSLDPMDLADIYSDYPLNKRRLDVFARGTLRNLLNRLERAGLKKTDSILDYGCGNGIFVDYLTRRGYRRACGYDPFVATYAEVPASRAPFDVIVNNDTLEHCEDITAMFEECLALLKSGGLLYVGTADAAPVDMRDLEPHVMRLHQPFHRVIITQATLEGLGRKFGLVQVASYRRSYHDTLRPFANYRFLDELNRAVDHDVDRALDPEESARTFLRAPHLWFFALFGYFFPSAYEPAVLLRKPH